MNLANKVMRWILVPVTALAVAGLTVFGGRWAVSLADSRCASENMVAGACVEGWQTGVAEMAIYAGIILASVGLVLLPCAVAPNGRRTVAVIGALIAPAAIGFLYSATRWQEFLMPFWVAVFVGLAASALVFRRSKRNAVD